jgi:hypothetical protein
MLVNKERVQRTLLTLYGTIKFSRTILSPEDKQSAKKLLDEFGKKTVCPVDDALGISDIPFKITRKAMSAIAREATKARSYSDAALELKIKFGEPISISTVERVTNYVGALMLQVQSKQMENAKKLSESRKIDARTIRKQRDDVLYIETDGAMIHVRDKEHVGMTNEEIRSNVKCMKHEPGWTESKHAICFHARDVRYCFEDQDGTRHSGRLDDILQLQGTDAKVIRHKIEKRDCIGYIGKSDQFQYHLLALAERNDWVRCSKVVILSDGAAWIKTAKQTVFNRKNVIQILDLFHAKENAGKFANEVRYTAKQRKQYADHLCDLIEQGKVDDLLKELETYKDRKMNPGVPNLYTYVVNNKDNMDYPKYKKEGLFVGSGAMESANIYMMQNRMKLQGMRWNVETGRYMLCLKSYHESHAWECVEDALSCTTLT